MTDNLSTIETQLRQLGLGEKEVAIYLLLAETGRTTAQPLARSSHLPRATVYFTLESLQEKGLVAAEKKKGTTFFSLTTPQALVRLLEREQEAAQQQLQLAKQLLPQLIPLLGEHRAKIPKLRYIEGKDAIVRWLEESEEDWYRSLLERDATWWGFDDSALFQSYQSWFEGMWKRHQRIRQDTINVRVFSDAPKAVRDELHHRFPRTLLRPLPSGYEFSSTFWLVGDFLVLIVAHDRPHYAFQIRDSVLAQNIRVIFRLLWKES